MPLTDDDVRRVAELARLALSDIEISQCRSELEQVLGYMQRLNEVDVEGVAAAPYPFDTTMPLRPDEQALWEYLNYGLALAALLATWLWRRRSQRVSLTRYKAMLEPR